MPDDSDQSPYNGHVPARQVPLCAAHRAYPFSGDCKIPHSSQAIFEQQEQFRIGGDVQLAHDITLMRTDGFDAEIFQFCNLAEAHAVEEVFNNLIFTLRQPEPGALTGRILLC